MAQAHWSVGFGNQLEFWSVFYSYGFFCLRAFAPIHRDLLCARIMGSHRFTFGAE